MEQNKQHDTFNKQKRTCIDSMLPCQNSLYIIIVDDGFIEEVVGCMDGGCQEKTTNLQDGGTKGGCLPHVLHEGYVDHRIDLRAGTGSNKNKNSRSKSTCK